MKLSTADNQNHPHFPENLAPGTPINWTERMVFLFNGVSQKSYHIRFWTKKSYTCFWFKSVWKRRKKSLLLTFFYFLEILGRFRVQQKNWWLHKPTIIMLMKIIQNFSQILSSAFSPHQLSDTSKRSLGFNIESRSASEMLSTEALMEEPIPVDWRNDCFE